MAVLAHNSWLKWVLWHIQNSNVLFELVRQNYALRYVNVPVAIAQLFWPFVLYGGVFLAISSGFNQLPDSGLMLRSLALLPTWVTFVNSLMLANASMLRASTLAKQVPLPIFWAPLAGVLVALVEYLVLLIVVVLVALLVQGQLHLLCFIANHLNAMIFCSTFALVCSLIVGLFPQLNTIVLMSAQLLMVFTPIIPNAEIGGTVAAHFPLNMAMAQSALALGVELNLLPSKLWLAVLANVVLASSALFGYYLFAHRIADR